MIVNYGLWNNGFINILMMQGVQILRIHDVNEIMQGIKIFKKIINN